MADLINPELNNCTFIPTSYPTGTTNQQEISENKSLEPHGGPDELASGYVAAAVGLTVVPPATMVYFEVDDYQEEENFDDQICLLSMSKNNLDQEFNYFGDLKKTSDDNHTQIVNYVMDHVQKKPGEPVGVPKVCDEELHRHLQQRFGSMNIDSEEYKTFFESYKAEVKEEYSEKIKEANGILDDCKYLEASEKIETFTKTVNPTKPVSPTTVSSCEGQSANVFKSKLDPFVVPRLPPKEFVLVNAIKEKFKMGPENEDYTTLKFDANLAYMEPCIHNLSFFKYAGTLQYPLVRSILQVMKDFPLGLTPKFLHDEFEIRNRYRIDYTSLGFNTFEDLLKRNSHVFKVLSGRTMVLVFPAFLENVNGVDFINKAIFHYLLVMLNLLKEPIPVIEMEKNMKNIFDINLNLKAWGFPSPLMYCQILLSICDSPGSVELVPSDENYLDDDSFLIRIAKKKIAIEEKLMDDDMFSSVVSMNQREKKSFIPRDINFVLQMDTACTIDDFIFCSQDIPSVGDELQIGSIHYVRPELMVTPNHFYISFEENSMLRDYFILEMTSRYEKWMKSQSKLFSVSPDLVHTLTYIAIKFEGEWVRGKLMHKYNSNSGYKVLLVDMGLYLRYVKIEDMKYLHKHFFTTPMQTILCSLQIDVLSSVFPLDNVIQNDSYNNNYCYPTSTLKAFYNLLTGRLLGIMPFSKTESRWEVYMFIIADDESKRVIMHDVASYLINIKGDLNAEEKEYDEILPP